MDDLLARVVDNLLDRVSGPMKFRFILQPVMAIFFGVVSGLRDGREGRPAYFWALLRDAKHREEMLIDGWKSVCRVFTLAILMDVVYQIIVLHSFYPVEAFLVAVGLAILPYLAVRGPVNSVTRRKQ